MLVDTHAHLMDAAFADDLDAVLARAAAAGVETIVCVGYDLASSRAAVALAAAHPGLFATVGVHPNYLAEAPPNWLPQLRELAGAPRVVGIGETGLDYYRAYTPPEVQRDGFRAHLQLAEELRLPAVIHCREAEEDLLDVLAARPAASVEPGVLHCFSGTASTMRAAAAAGYYISLAGTVTFKSAASLREVAAAVPAERLLVETDCPYLSPMPHRGQRNEPARVRLTAACIAETRGVPLETVARQTTANAARLFGWAAEAVA
ncbi:MAG TPA: TatD family hydrolase [Chloroflexota bacterium]|nr:TatD family hydrolase [Chloroflexota bacterium]